MRFMDLELARRVEMAEADSGRACAEALGRLHPEVGVAIRAIGGGIAVFAGIGSPVTQAIGVGLDGAVTETELDRLEDFFWSRGAAAELEVCPLVDLSLYQLFAERDYRLTEVSNVLVRELAAGGQTDFAPAGAGVAGVTVRGAEPNEGMLWTSTVAQGFAEQYPVTDALIETMQAFFDRDGQCRFYLAFVGPEVAGGAAVAAHKGVGGLFGASTLPAFRRRGVQSALLAERLRWARTQGCDMVVSIAQPASASQRNIERFGFRVAYTRTKLARSKPESV
jgi:GNAT superfamily N-acetyltransferase